MDFFPVFLNLRDRHCLVVGGGNTATRKIQQLLQAQARVTVIAPLISSQIGEWVNQSMIHHQSNCFQPSDLQNYCLVIAATNDKTVNQQVSKLAQQRNIPVNVVDQLQLCSFIMPSMIDRSPVQIAVSTGGTSPVLARLLRARLETLIPATYGQLGKFVARHRIVVKEKLPQQARRQFWETVLQGNITEMVLAGHIQEAEQALETLLNQFLQTGTIVCQGEVYLVGAGPGDPDLLTFRALRLMQQADVVVHDRLISPGVLALVRREAEKIYVGKQPTYHTVPQEQINQLLIRLAKEGKRVLRLKGGDPFVFGRGGEEIETLLAEAIPFQVVPGITAALGAACYAGIPLTHRDYAQSCVFVTGHLKDNSMNLNWNVLVQPHQTVVVYMGLRGINILCQELIIHGLSADKPAALVQQATLPEQRVIVGTLATLPTLVEAAHTNLPSLIIIGEVVKLHNQLNWFKSSENSDHTV